MAKGKRRKTKKSPAKKSQARLLAVLRTICIIAVVLVLLVIAAQRFGNITFSSVSDYFSTLLSSAKSGDGYPYYFETTKVDTVLPIGSDLLVVSEDSTFVLDSTARKISNEQHSLSDPVVRSVNGRALFLDIGENAYQIQSKTKVLYSGSFPQKLLTGTIGKDGTVALVSRGESAQTQLTVLNRNQKEIFVWNCANENIIAVALSDNGKRAAVSAVGAKDGELYSKVHIFDFDYAEPIASFNYNTAVSGVEFLSCDRLLITGTNVFELVEDDTKTLEEDLSLNTLSNVYTSDGNQTVAVLSKYGSSTAKIIRVYNKKGEKLFETELAESVKGVSCDERYISVLTDNDLYSYNTKGELVGKHSVDADSIRPFTDGKYTYVWTMSTIQCYKTTETEEETVPSETQTESASQTQ